MMVSAWECGADGSMIPHMTPSEVKGLFEARSANMRREQADMDILSWLIGSYTAHGVNAPKSYPDLPRNAGKILGTETQDSGEMSAEEMKNVLIGIAQRSGHNGA